MDMQHMHTHIHNYQLLNTWKELEPKQDELLAIGHSFCLYCVVYSANYLLNLRLQVSQELGFKGEFISDYPMYQGICSIFCTESDTFFFSSLSLLFIFPGTLARNHGLHCPTRSRGHSQVPQLIYPWRWAQGSWHPGEKWWNNSLLSSDQPGEWQSTVTLFCLC